MQVSGAECSSARSQWELCNSVTTDHSFSFPNAHNMAELHRTQPWKVSPRYFRRVKVSVLAAMQMMLHAKRGSPNVSDTGSQSIPTTTSPPLVTKLSEQRRENWFEVMGLLLGHFNAHELTVTSTFALPVDASEVECSMNDASQLYMLDFLQYYQRSGTFCYPKHAGHHGSDACGNASASCSDDEGSNNSPCGGRHGEECCIGWYHSHPGYGCFLSRTDVDTQRLSQAAQDPWLAIVIDPVRTMASGRIDIRAFRTLPEATEEQQKQSCGNSRTRGNSAQLPIDVARENIRMQGNTASASVVKEYGAHACQYYELPVTLVRSKNDEIQLDCLWSRYWIQCLSTNPLSANRHVTAQEVHHITNALKEYVTQRSTRLPANRTDGGSKDNREEALHPSIKQVNRLASLLELESMVGGTLLMVKKAIFKT
ncbi:putative metallopeptidase [Trypanosoma vivax]|nr:putative metallopeptidase [Trypanosoma vivax]